MKEKKTIVLGISGSIAAFKSAELASRLVQKGFEVKVIMTEAAEQFITPLTLQVLSCNKVYRGMFEDLDAWEVEHVCLADSASVVLIAPATANCIGKIASGICDDLLTCVVAATKAPVLIAPAMNDGMYENKIIQENIGRLKKNGYRFVGPVKGRLACGRVSVGRMSDVDDIIESVLRLVR